MRELRDKADGETVKELMSFLEDRIDVEVKAAGDMITIGEENGPSKAYLRVLIRKFLHRADLKEDFRVISSKENVFTIKERKGAGEE